MRKYDKMTQINILNELFYKNLPNFFNAEIKEMFNFFSEAEKTTWLNSLFQQMQTK